MAEAQAEITLEERRGIKRVYESLCGLGLKSRIRRRIAELEARPATPEPAEPREPAWLRRSLAPTTTSTEEDCSVAETEVVATSSPSIRSGRPQPAPENLALPAIRGANTARQIEADREAAREAARLRAKLGDLGTQDAGAMGVKPVDLMEIHRQLGNPITRKQAEEMIWEVDEDMGYSAQLEEFLLTYQRNLQDQTGLEPSKLFNLIQFLVYDSQSKGYVTADDTMSIMFTRYGRSQMESKLHEIFGDESGTVLEEKTITFAEYLVAMEKTKLSVFLSSSQGRKAAAFATKLP